MRFLTHDTNILNSHQLPFIAIAMHASNGVYMSMHKKYSVGPFSNAFQLKNFITRTLGRMAHCHFNGVETTKLYTQMGKSQIYSL